MLISPLITARPAVFFLLLMTGLCLLPASHVNAQPLSIVLSDPPVENGITISRDRIGFRLVTVGNETVTAAVSGHKSVPADEWARSFLLTLTNPQIRNGKMPAVDIEVVYMHEGNTEVTLVADTLTGSRVVGRAWGNKREWQTMKVRIDDAFFGARDHKNDPKTLPVDGYDLRLNAAAGDFFLKSVKVTPIDPNKVTDWSRFLSIDDIKSTSGFVIEPGKTDTIRFLVRNSARVDATLQVTTQTLDANGKALDTKQQEVIVNANGTTPIEAIFQTSQDSPQPSDPRPVGEYAVRISARVADESEPVLRRDQPVVIAGPNDLFIVFDKEPILRGMDFDRTQVQPVEINVNGTTRWAWRALSGSQRGGEPWWRSVMLNITDPTFQNAGRTASDVTVNYRLIANAPMNVVADTRAGSRTVMEGWGRNDNWQRQVVRIDDALFNRTNYSSEPNDLRTDGFDLRVNFNTGDGELRSVFVRGYPLDKPDFTRLLRFDSVDAGRELFIFTPGEKADLKLKLTNLASLPLNAVYTVILTDDFGKEIWSHQHNSTITPLSGFDVPVPFDTTGLNQGVYTMKLSLGTKQMGAYSPLIERDINVMVSEKSPIAKAKDGEFLYGMDMGVDSTDERWLQWADFMGVDIFRNSGHGHNHVDVSSLERAMASIEKYKLRSMIMFDIPWQADPAGRQASFDNLAREASAIAAKYADKVLYYEMGNEPDLTYFYPGPIEDYAKGYEQVSRAIKAADPTSIIMNGGLCFAGAEGDQRARRFMEVVDASTIDAWAYHAHGPGAQSERAMVEKVRAEAAKWGKDGRPLVQTESGVSARTPAQIRVQARTVIQKMVYAQSTDVPAFMWFRLYMTGGDGDYTNLKNVNEPRPVILSYRTMTRTLKGMKFVRTLPMNSADQEAYLFAEPDGNRRAMVWWTGGQAGGLSTLNLGSPATNLRQTDLFGNVTNLPDAAAGIVPIPIDNDPAFLTWTTDNPATALDGVALMPSPLEAPTVVRVTPGQRDGVQVIIRNTTALPIDATLVVRAGPNATAKPTQDSRDVRLEPKATAHIVVHLITAADDNLIDWPARWVVFTGLPEGGAQVESIDGLPSELKIDGQTFAPRIVRPINGMIDFAPMTGAIRERAESLSLAEVISPDDRTVRVGASADWWMAWFVNGKPVFNTLENGNGGSQSLLTHQFDLPLKKGRNLIAVRVLAGSQGFRFMSGGPAELLAARSTGGELGANLSLELRAGESVLARQTLVVARRHVIQPPAAPFDGDIKSTLAALTLTQPAGDFLEQNITNDWAKQPDSSKWWKGDTDLSGSVWVFADTASLYVLVAVNDDVAQSGDNVELKIADESRTSTLIDAKQSAARIDRVESASGGKTYYRFTIDRSKIDGIRLSINARVIDDDFGVLKQVATWLTWSDSPTDGWQAVLQGK